MEKIALKYKIFCLLPLIVGCGSGLLYYHYRNTFNSFIFLSKTIDVHDICCLSILAQVALGLTYFRFFMDFLYNPQKTIYGEESREFKWAMLAVMAAQMFPVVLLPVYIVLAVYGGLYLYFKN